MVDYERLRLFDSRLWTAYLHGNQHYLGRSYLWAKREDADDFLSMSGPETAEFFRLGRKLRVALDGLFAPDMYNYAALQNEAPHLHVHFIPRYQAPREFAGVRFEDKRWGKNYAPYDANFTVPEGSLLAIRDALRERLR